ncbi:MATE family efflux transporter [Ruminococcus gauvreauii]|uniref:Probable multidrug resistance protein NorM n=1 Tax=Ruminococcus gauvreauii TaxID=438033 RepID=A0ABY5VI19_9FIRM|nr:MATE family efflux transporter [Ruminococcus gauvreauii]UWP59851.1 MATE family efflux transporter [Ruminococcus gauvreauii]
MNQRKQLKKYIIPAIVSNIAFFILTIVDGMFVGNGVGTDALGAINMAMPFVMLAGALSALFAVGGVAVAAIRFGRGDESGANQAFMHSITANLIVFAIFSIVGIGFSDKIANLLGANATYHGMVSEYIRNYSLFLIPAGLNLCLSSFCRNDGNPKISTIAAIVCTAVNIFADWLFVFPLQKGVGGAAIATGIAQTIAVLVLLTHYFGKKGKLRFKKFQVHFALYRKIMLRGFPEMVSQFAAPITTVCMNSVLIRMGDVYVNAYSVAAYAGALFAAMMYGLSTGLQPLFGSSYGAKDEKSLRYFLRSGIAMSAIGGLVIFAATFLIGKPVSLLFGANPAAIEVVSNILPKYCLNFVFAAISAVLASYLFSTKRTNYAITLNVCRSILINSACILLLPMLFGNSFVWYTLAVSEAICLLIAAVLWKYSERKGIVYR